MHKICNGENFNTKIVAESFPVADHAAGVTRRYYPRQTVRSPQEKAFDIDLIAELVFSNLDFHNLLTCRLVSSRWNFVCSKALEKIVVVHFKQLPPWLTDSYKNAYYSGEARFQFFDLNTVMDNSLRFPSTSFRMTSEDLISPSGQSFLNAHGHGMKSLELYTCHCRTTGRVTQGQFSTTRSRFKDVVRLLLVQTPNLEQLVIKGDVLFRKSNASFKNSMEANNDGSMERRTRQSGLQTNKNLKYLRIQSSISQTIFERIVGFCPNLKQVDLNYGNLHFLVQPENRLQLLRKLKIHFCDIALSSLALLLEHSQGKLEVREVQVDWTSNLAQEPNRWPLVVEIINKILKMTSHSCEKLVWPSMRFLIGLEVPKMPNVKQLTLNYNYCPLKELWDPNKPTQFFPARILLSDTFPNLKSVAIRTLFFEVESPIITLFDNLEVVPSVRRVTSELFYQENIVDSFQKMFPCATLSFPKLKHY